MMRTKTTICRWNITPVEEENDIPFNISILFYHFNPLHNFEYISHLDKGIYLIEVYFAGA